MKKLITFYLLNSVALVLCSTTTSDQIDARKANVRSTASTVISSHLNALQSSQNNGIKTQSVQLQTSGGENYQSDFNSSPQSIYSQPTAPTGGYFISVNPQSVSTSALSTGPTPVIMQYLPHNTQQGPIQYLQLIPTRPLIVPISPYISTSASSPQAQGLPSASFTLAHDSYSPSNTHSFGSNYQPSIQNPMGGFSTNYLTYFRPNHGMQIVKGPMDLTLNTNEYIPLQSESPYKMRGT